MYNGKTDEELYRDPRVLEAYRRRQPKITRDNLNATLEKSVHPAGEEFTVLQVYEPYLPDVDRFSDCAFRRYGELLTDDDVQVGSFVLAAIKRKCFDIAFRPGVKLAVLFAFFLNPDHADESVIRVAHMVRRHIAARQAGDVPAFDLAFLRNDEDESKDYLKRLRTAMAAN